MQKKLLIIGGGGFAKEVFEIAQLNGYSIYGCLDDEEDISIKCNYLGKISNLESISDNFDAAFVAIGAYDSQSLSKRISIIKLVSGLGINMATLISPHAIISSGVEIKNGCFIAHGVVICVDAKIKDNVIVNANAVIGHDSLVKNNCIIAPSAFIGGSTSIGENSFIGPCSQILQGLSLGKQTIVSSGALVKRSIPDKTSVFAPRSKIFES